MKRTVRLRGIGDRLQETLGVVREGRGPGGTPGPLGHRGQAAVRVIREGHRLQAVHLLPDHSLHVGVVVATRSAGLRSVSVFVDTVYVLVAVRPFRVSVSV